MTTLETLLGTVKSAFESYPIHEAVVNYAASRAGKPITKRDTAKLEAENPGWHFSVSTDGSSWSPKKSISFWKKDDRVSFHSSELTVSRGTGLARFMSGQEIREDSNNARYFKYAAERNGERAAALNPDTAKPVGLATAAKLTDEIILLYKELKATIAAYELPSDAEHAIRKILKEETGEDIKLY